jgi:YidC/Oxa1 family membrane protein insertase
MGAISNIFGYLLNWLYNLCGNYGLSIIIFSIILRIALMPLTIKQQKTMKKSAEMQDKIKQIQFKYKNDPEKLNKETIELYKKEKMSPFSGCLSAILQLIIFVSVFYLVGRPLTYMKKLDPTIIEGYVNELKQDENNNSSKYYEIEIIQKKSAENPDVYINMNFLGLDLSKVPNQNVTDISVYIIPVLYVLTSFISIKMTSNVQETKKSKNTNTDEQQSEQDEAMESMQQMNKSMTYMMPIMSIFIAFITPLGLALYWLISNVLMIVERIIIDTIEKRKEKLNENIN